MQGSENCIGERSIEWGSQVQEFYFTYAYLYFLCFHIHYQVARWSTVFYDRTEDSLE